MRVKDPSKKLQFPIKDVDRYNELKSKFIKAVNDAGVEGVTHGSIRKSMLADGMEFQGESKTWQESWFILRAMAEREEIIKDGQRYFSKEDK